MKAIDHTRLGVVTRDAIIDSAYYRKIVELSNVLVCESEKARKCPECGTPRETWLLKGVVGYVLICDNPGCSRCGRVERTSKGAKA